MPPENREISSQTLAALREALASRVDARAAEPSQELRAALARFAAEARESGIPPERLLVELHGLWDRVIEERRPESHEERQALRERLVALCIEHYYALGALVCACTVGMGLWRLGR